ncbi:hypothetical protein HD597_003661 [Nonomuraea thailandensis]|uniref:Uncharacterized protein n=1 Tax=Nonomuraea thailandensis TaxID=1188745 RepID=A0A9X2GJL7_9ACTN|nr:hypothetical protein [Nonomuraea thailandensis]MCP2356641.1 hypothetical protein [Nonomuraea thailandensis]
MAGAASRCTPDPDGGVVVVTRFDCGGLWRLLAFRIAHAWISARITPRLEGLVFIATRTDVAARRVLSVTLFRNLDQVYQMGTIPAHIKAARVTRRFGVRTRGAIFANVGDWRTVLFDAMAGEPVID